MVYSAVMSKELLNAVIAGLPLAIVVATGIGIYVDHRVDIQQLEVESRFEEAFRDRTYLPREIEDRIDAVGIRISRNEEDLRTAYGRMVDMEKRIIRLQTMVEDAYEEQP
jgi:hypothetical protein